MRLSDGSLVDDWRYRPPVVIPEPEPIPDPAVLLADRIVNAVEELKHALAALPAPQVHIEKPDLAAVVSAVTAASPTSITAEDIGRAVADALQIPEPPSNEPLVDAIVKAFEKMDHRLQGMPAFGASGPSNISSDPNREVGRVTTTGGETIATQSTLAAIKAKTDNLDVLLSTRTKPADEQKSRDRDENAAFLYHAAGGVISVASATWVTLASITVPAGKTLRLLYAEGDLAELAGIGNGRGIRIRQGTTVKAVALVGADQPNPDIEGLTLANTSGGNETWDIQGRHTALTSQDMVGWFTWTEVND